MNNMTEPNVLVLGGVSYNAMIYLDRTVIFVNRGGMWLHMPLDELLAKAL